MRQRDTRTAEMPGAPTVKRLYVGRHRSMHGCSNELGVTDVDVCDLLRENNIGRDDEDDGHFELARKGARLARELGRVPTTADFKLEYGDPDKYAVYRLYGNWRVFCHAVGQEMDSGQQGLGDFF
jgi:hypothetical protein